MITSFAAYVRNEKLTIKTAHKYRCAQRTEAGMARRLRSRKMKGPTRAAREARATVISDDIFADRTAIQYSSDVQRLPQGDKRYRTTHSAKFYIVQLIGTWVAISESAERTVQYGNGMRRVRFENRLYELKKVENFKAFVGRFIQGGCYAYVGGKDINTIKELNSLIQQDFIYISSSESLRIFNELKKENEDRKRLKLPKINI